MRSIYPRRIRVVPPGFVVRNQGRGNKCQTYTLGNKARILRERAVLTSIGEPSEHAMYYDATKRVQGLSGDPGASFWHLQQSLASYGMPTVPWSDGGDLRRVNEPPPDVIASGLANKPVAFEMAPYICGGPSMDDLHETMAMLLADGKPVPITMQLSTNFWDLQHWDVAQCQYVYDPSDHRGEHAALIVGRDMDKGIYEVLNSWGPDWGAYGYFSITFEAFRRCVTQHWHLAKSPYPTVKEFNVASNPVPASVAAATMVAYLTKTGVKAQLIQAFETSPMGNWQALLDKAAEHKLPAVVVEILANLPANIIEDYVNRGQASYPAELFYV